MHKCGRCFWELHVPMNILRAFNPKVYDLCDPYRVTRDEDMPEEYRQGHRPLHDDWFFGEFVCRMDTARRVPLPFRQDTGDCEKRWMLWDPSYPASPNLRIENREYRTAGGVFNLPHALVDCQVEGSGLATFSAYLNGQWVPCFKSYRKVIAGRLLAMYSGGLKADITVSVRPDGSLRSDIMGWWDPPSLSWNRI